MLQNKTAQLKVIDPETNKSKYIKFVTSGCTLYFNAQHHLVKLSAKERCFFDYLCECMRASTNDIVIDSNQKESFVRHYEACTFKKLEMEAVNKYAPKFKALNLIIDTPQKALYIVNPKYVFKGSNHMRMQYIKRLIENRLAEGLSIAALVNVPKTKFGG